jgi:hypothetical protein
MYFGKIYRDSKNRTLKQLGLKTNQSIVVQMLDEPEQLDEFTIVILLTKRDVRNRTYGPKQEHHFRFPQD